MPIKGLKPGDKVSIEGSVRCMEQDLSHSARVYEKQITHTFEGDGPIYEKRAASKSPQFVNQLLAKMKWAGYKEVERTESTLWVSSKELIDRGTFVFAIPQAKSAST